MASPRFLIALLLLAAAIAHGEPGGMGSPAAADGSAVYALFAVTPGFDMGGPGDVAGTDYYISGADLDRLAVGDRLWVERPRRLRPPASPSDATLLIPVATVRIIQVGEETAVTRVETLLPRRRQPHLTYATPMVGDRLVAVPPQGFDTVVVLPSDVLFDFDRAEIRADARPVLDTLAAGLADHPEGVIEVHGYTDSLGPPAYNHRLSLTRAQAVTDYLAATAHLSPDRFRIVGHGENQPAADNATLAGRQQNRRVAIRLPIAPRPKLTHVAAQ